MPGTDRLVTVIGSLSIDVNTTTSKAEPERRLGGVVTYAGLTYRRHGVATRAVFNRAVVDEGIEAPLVGAGIDCRIGPTRATTSFHNQVDGDGRHQRVDAIADPIRAELAAEACRGVRVVHLGPLLPSDLDERLLQNLTALDDEPFIALDVQGLCRAVRDDGDVVLAVAAGARRWLERADIIKCDETELAAMLKQFQMSSVNALAEAFGIREIVETHGSRGGRAHTLGGATYRYRARSGSGDDTSVVMEVADTVGAGDVFFAAYLTARCLDGESFEAASQVAAETAGLQVGGRYLDARAFRLASASP